MENRANHLLIGSFVLIVIAALFVFVIWLSRVQVDQKFAFYKIYFEGSVAGLSIGGNVRYRGIPIGKVTEISVSPDDPTRVMVTTKVDEATPIRQGDQASLQLQGITGIAYINIKGAGPADQPIVAEGDEELPVIPSRRSQIEQLVEGAPELLNRGIMLVEQVSGFLNEGNQKRVAGILEDVNSLTASLASRRDGVTRIIDALDESSDDVAGAAQALRKVAERADALLGEVDKTLIALRDTLRGADGVIGNELNTAVKDVRSAARSVEGLAEAAQSVLTDNQDSLEDFAGEGLNEFTRFVTEARLLVAGLSRVTERFETDGARFLLGERSAEFQAEPR